MIIHKDLTIQLKETQIRQLKNHYRQVIRHLEEGFPLKMKVLEALKNDLSGIINESPQWQEVLHAIHDGDDFYCIRLMHSDNEILNLPWSMAVDNKTNKQLGNIERLYLTKSIPECFEEKGADFPKAPAPLKVLVMISSPEDTEWKHRLSYEEEEYAILKAFEPLMQQGAVEVDFTENGSLEALERKLKANKYHILHFSGHAIFREKDNAGYLQLEDSLTLKTHLAAAEDFADAVNCHPQHKVPMVMLASCQTAQGNTEEGLIGVTNHLLRQGVPVVISMGMAVKDKYAALFSAYFYRELAEKKTILSAFNEAIDYLRNREYNDIGKKPGSREIPLQWIIPNLYLSRKVEEVVDWNQPQEELKFSSQRYIFGQKRLLLSHEKDYRFIGRRKDKAEILGPFFEKVPILLKGQGGVGKTAMAEHLVQRLIAKEPKTVPFLFDESTRSIKEILDRLQDFLIDQEHEHVSQYEKAMDKFQYLLFQVKETHQPVFVFDNLESFQKEPGEDLAETYSDIKEVIAYLCERKICHMILTCRYPVPGFKSLRDFDLNQVGFNDFWKKCLYMNVGDIHILLLEIASIEKAREGFLSRPGLQYINVVKLLHDTFGGNYWALEFFDRLVKENPDKIIDSLDSLEKFRESYKETTDQVKHKMGQNLLFSKLMTFLSPEHQRILELLSHFLIPVQQFALQLQIKKQPDSHSIDFRPMLEALRRLTLIEIIVDQETSICYYYITSIVKDLLENHPKIENPYPFSHNRAGIYYYHTYYNLGDHLTSLEEAFYHFEQSGNKEKIQSIGERLTRFFQQNAMHRSAFNYAFRSYQSLGEKAGGAIFGTLGLCYRLFGDNTKSSYFNERSLTAYQKSGDKIGESALLSNIGRLHIFIGDYSTALKYVEQSLKICRGSGNKQGECAVLNHLSEIYNTRGNYEEALKHHKQSLKISREIEDEKAEAAALNNMGRVYDISGNYDKAINCAELSLEISRKIGDKWEEGTTLSNIGEIYRKRKEFDTAMKYFEQAIKIFREVGNKPNEATTLNNIGLIYSEKGGCDRALKYLNESLRIRRKIGDKSGEGTTLNSIGFAYYHLGDHENALKYLKQSLEIRQGIGAKRYEWITLNNIIQTYCDLGDFQTALKYLELLLRVCQDIGDKQMEEEALHKICYHLYILRDYDKAFKYTNMSLKLSSELDNKSGIISAFHNMALIANDLDYIKEFIKLETAAYHMAIEIKDTRNIFVAGSHLGTKLYYTGSKEEGVFILKKCYEIGKAERFPDVKGVEEMLREIGEL